MPIDVLRRLAATLAYRAAQVLRDAPPRFVASTFAPSTGQPVHIVAHMADLMAWGVTLAATTSLQRERGQRDSVRSASSGEPLCEMPGWTT